MQLFSGLFPVCYRQFYLFFNNRDWDGDLVSCFVGQVNGLCGASNSSSIFLTTGLHTGNITLTINLYDAEPEIDFSKDEIVEASFSLENEGIWLEAWAGEFQQKFNLSIGDYRIRYSAKDFGLAEDQGCYDEGDIEFYNIDIWPSKIQKDKIIKVTSERAAYWHDVCRQRNT